MIPANMYLLKVSNRNTRNKCEIWVNNKNTRKTSLTVDILVMINHKGKRFHS